MNVLTVSACPCQTASCTRRHAVNPARAIADAKRSTFDLAAARVGEDRFTFGRNPSRITEEARLDGF